ncbi:YceG family protein (plasmid) [Aneurinibacillus sp. Ricciae_BoGa-3]|uniref:YceG family protein n=1 Tax=Aneurinibacillus sp. Ricciae_BoGa-3 TaxID=3022697 RepID=UPI002341BCB6|nr:YceG family protein [Aneurinibacillus sp. Ricciae_BoGa-3]WCK57274.1 YceG family protein [Aneurinibacillus sp. Ricciae_BoGa-3]
MVKPYHVKLLESKQILTDISVPLKNRLGYIDGESLILPIYFYRCVGINGLNTEEQDIFFNTLYELNQSLEKSIAGYIKMEGHLLMPSSDEINEVTKELNKVGIGAGNGIDGVIKRILTSHVLDKGIPPIFYPSIAEAFRKVITLYASNERTLNVSKMENFAVKITAWFQRYAPHLLRDGSLSDVPKVVFYGDIKPHEVYFLTFLALIGMDVLFIHTEKEKDSVFDEVDREGVFTKKIENPYSLPLPAFPSTGRAIRKTTVAYSASKEIDTVLYGNDSGLFKAWQYEKDITKAITLKTTYEELKILWNEEAKFRSEFEVKDEKVYVPNLFAKINGTNEDLNEYARDIRMFTSTEHTVLLPQVPFTPITYSKQELYSTAFLFTKEGFVDKELLYKSPVYKLKYLKESIQDLIVYKINELISSKPFKKEIDEKMRLRILMTVITMEPQLLRLIEVFDFTSKVPKIVVYDNQRDIFSEEDTIIIAFFNVLGADIVIFTPTNYTNIEHGIQEERFDIHQLPSVRFEIDFASLPMPKNKEVPKSIWQKLFG